jgi:circadian clock protein KaiB
MPFVQFSSRPMCWHTPPSQGMETPYEIHSTLDHRRRKAQGVACRRFLLPEPYVAMNKRTLFKFRLYTADHTMNSTEALANLTALCALHLPDRHEIEVVNVLLNPRRALADHIRMTPTLLKLSPSPVQRITGTLSQTPLVLAALGLQTAPA